MPFMKRRTFLSLMGAAALTSSMMLTGCGAGSGDDRKIVRIGHEMCIRDRSLAVPHRAEPYSMPCRYFLAFLPRR